MCIAVFAIHQGNFPLVIAANRDEWLDRPAAPVQWWTDTNQHVLAGQDLSAGGTWFGVSRSGHFGLITNIRSDAMPVIEPNRPSRGELVLRWLNHKADAQSFKESIDTAQYVGFNLILGNLATSEVHFLSNAYKFAGQLEDELEGNPSTPADPIFSKLPDGIHGLSNASLNTPWPKLTALKEAIDITLREARSAHDQNHNYGLHSRLLGDLLNPYCFDPDSPLSAINVSAQNFMNSRRDYGRRCSTTLSLDRQREVIITETQRDGSQKTFQFSL